MLIVIFILSLVLVILAKTSRLPLSSTVRKRLLLAGEFGLGLIIGLNLYTHGTELSKGILEGLSGK